MSKVMITARIPEALGERLEDLAESTKRSKAFLLTAALESYVDKHAWMTAEIEESIRDADASGEFISQEAMEKWSESLVTDKPLPPPEADVFKGKRM